MDPNESKAFKIFVASTPGRILAPSRPLLRRTVAHSIRPPSLPPCGDPCRFRYLNVSASRAFAHLHLPPRPRRGKLSAATRVDRPRFRLRDQLPGRSFFLCRLAAFCPRARDWGNNGTSFAFLGGASSGLGIERGRITQGGARGLALPLGVSGPLARGADAPARSSAFRRSGVWRSGFSQFGRQAA